MNTRTKTSVARSRKASATRTTEMTEPVVTGPRIYNLFPLLVGRISTWRAELPRMNVAPPGAKPEVTDAQIAEIRRVYEPDYALHEAVLAR